MASSSDRADLEASHQACLLCEQAEVMGHMVDEEAGGGAERGEAED